MDIDNHLPTNKPTWSSPWNQHVPFLSLPSFLRRKIYMFAGIVRSCPIDLNHESPRRRAEYRRYCEGQLLEEMYIEPLPIQGDTLSSFCCFYQNRKDWHNTPLPGPDGIDCICVPPHLGLLTVSRAIHEEVIEMLYSENQFKISRTAPGGLQPLFKLGLEALRSMTSLHIRLNACGCVPGHACGSDDRFRQCVLTYSCETCHYGCRCGQDQPSSLTDSNVPDMLAEWKSLNTYLATRLTPGHLKLSVVCDTIGGILPEQILSCMTPLPLLAQCGIRLAQCPDSSLQLAIKTVVRQLTTPKTGTSSQQFRWNDLPVELQSNIMRHTCLIRSTKVDWSDYAYKEKPYCCGRCTDVLDTCCCPTIHAAFSSKQCACRPQFLNYFLVSKSFRQQAVQAFFCLNTFYIQTNIFGDGDLSERDPRRRSVLKFLQAIPGHSLHLLRTIYISFALSGYSDIRIDPLALHDWEETLSFIRDHLDLARLNIKLSVKLYGAPPDNPYILEIREDQSFQAIIRPIRQILQGGLQNIVVDFYPAPPTSARAERNRVRAKELASQAMGLSKLDTESIVVLRGIDGCISPEEVGDVLIENDMFVW